MKIFKKLDQSIFITAVVLYLCIFLSIVINPTVVGVVVDALVDVTINSLGVVYVLACAFVLIVFLALPLSRFGRVRLGQDDDRPEFSFFSWVGMLFGAGLGVGLVFFGVSEPVIHFMTAPFAENQSPAAASDAMRLSFFHWSFLPWCLYGMVGLCMAYFQHRQNLPGLLSSTFYPMLGERIYGAPGKIINTFSLIAIICGASMSLGFASTQFTSGLAMQYGFEDSFLAICFTVVGIGIISTLSAVSGVEKGIKFISDGNMYTVIFFIIFTLIFGETTRLINLFFESYGDLVTSLPKMMFFLDSNGAVAAKTNSNWVGEWTVMYWAWWVAFAPFVGGFLAKISKGRTIREFVLASALAPGALCCIWFAFFGGSAIFMDLFGNRNLCEIILTDTDNSLFVFLQELPIPAFTIPLAMLLIITLIVTSVNSATYVSGQFSTKDGGVPSLGIRAFWGVFIATNAVLFIYLGGLNTLKSTAIVLAFPFIIIIICMVVNLLKALFKLEIKPPTI